MPILKLEIFVPEEQIKDRSDSAAESYAFMLADDAGWDQERIQRAEWVGTGEITGMKVWFDHTKPKIPQIKVIRRLAGTGLAQARDIVEAHALKPYVLDSFMTYEAEDWDSVHAQLVEAQVAQVEFVRTM